MGYFDAWASASFKAEQDGRRLYFPWGVLGRGYVIESEQDSKRLKLKIKIFWMVSLCFRRLRRQVCDPACAAES